MQPSQSYSLTADKIASHFTADDWSELKAWFEEPDDLNNFESASPSAVLLLMLTVLLGQIRVRSGERRTNYDVVH